MSGHRVIVVIEQDKKWRDQLSRFLRAAGLNVYETSKRQDGLQLMFKMHPDLIFLGIQPSSEESWETLGRIRSLTDVPVVLMAERIPGSDRRRANELGAPGILRKPISNKKLSECIAAHLGVIVETAVDSSPEVGRVQVSRGRRRRGLRLLTDSQLVQIDAALARVGQRGEVWLIKNGRYLKYITTVTEDEWNAVRTFHPA